MIPESDNAQAPDATTESAATDAMVTSPAPDAPDIPEATPGDAGQPAAVSAPPSRWRGRRNFAIAFLFGLLAVLAVSAGAMAAFDRSYDGRILPGLHAAGIDLGGLTPAQALERLQAADADLQQGSLSIVADKGDAVEVTYAELNRRYDAEAMVQTALAVGRDGSLVERVARNLRTAVNGLDVAPRILVDEAVLGRAIDRLAATYRIEPVDAAIIIESDGFVVTPAVQGRSAATDVAAAATSLVVDPAAPSETKIVLRVSTQEPAISTEQATVVRDQANRMVRDIQLSTDADPVVVPAAEVRTWLAFDGSTGTLRVIVDSSLVQTALLEIAPQYSVAPVDATFQFKDTNVVGVVPGTEGRELDVAATAQLIEALLDERGAGQDVNLVTPALTAITPTLATADAETLASKMTVIGAWTTYFPIGIKNGQGANIWIPAKDLDGKVIAPGALFDFWKEIGPVTREHGYTDGGAIINGKTEPQGALAGGICSCSTTLFNAALRAGLEMGARRNHYYYIDRYPLGLDATVFQSSSGSVQTMSFTNDTPYPIIIRSLRWRVGTKGYVRFELYSLPLERTVKFTTPIVKNVKPAKDTIEYTSTLPYGTKQRIEYPVDGKDVWVTRTVTDASGKIVHQETYYSHYSRVDGVTLVGTKGAPSPSPTPTPSPTPSPTTP
jgi:vancomycin resistance protein YoaR